MTTTTDEVKAVIDVPPSEPPASPALVLLRDEAGILQNILAILSEARIQAKEYEAAGRILDYVKAKIIMSETAIAAQLEKEGKTVAA